jgi:hypothetical protein
MPKSVEQVKQELLGNTQLWNLCTEKIDQKLPDALAGVQAYGLTYIPASTPPIMLDHLKETYRKLGWQLTFEDADRDGISVKITLFHSTGH